MYLFKIFSAIVGLRTEHIIITNEAASIHFVV